MSDPVPPDPSLLVLDSDEEVFLRAATNIEDTEELRSHIQRIALEAFEVGKLGDRSLKMSPISPAGVSIWYD
jgi:hypothetical protein